MCFWVAGSLFPTLGHLLFVVFEAYPRPRSPNWFCPSLNCPFLWEIKLGTFPDIEIHTGCSRRERSNMGLNWGLSHGSICTSVSIALQPVTVLSCGSLETSPFASCFPAGFSDRAEVVFTIGCSGLWTAVLNVLVEGVAGPCCRLGILQECCISACTSMHSISASAEVYFLQTEHPVIQSEN